MICPIGAWREPLVTSCTLHMFLSFSYEDARLSRINLSMKQTKSYLTRIKRNGMPNQRQCIQKSKCDFKTKHAHMHDGVPKSLQLFPPTLICPYFSVFSPSIPILLSFLKIADGKCHWKCLTWILHLPYLHNLQVSFAVASHIWNYQLLSVSGELFQLLL